MRDALGAVQRILVVGGTSEIGGAIATRLARPRAAHVLLAGRDAAALARAGAEMVRAGAGAADAFPFDATDRASGALLAERAFAGGDIDVVVIAVGLLGDQAAAERDGDAAAAIIEANLAGVAPALVGIADRLRTQGHGALVVLSSFAAVRPRRENFVYGAAKAGLDALSRGLAAALDGCGVQVLVVRPGFVATRMTDGIAPAPFASTPAQVAAAVEEGIRGRRRVVWVPGVLRWVALVVTALPEPVMRRLPR